MPFEISPKEVSVAEKLAALMEAGQVANPHVRHVRNTWGNGETRGCAMTFVALGAGIKGIRENVGDEIAQAIGATVGELRPLVRRVMEMNDWHECSVSQIAEHLRNGTYPQPKPRHSALEGWIIDEAATFDIKAYASLVVQMNASSIKWISYDIVGDPAKFDSATIKPAVKAIPQPAKKVRTNAKTGATWPVAKHCYA